LLDELTYRSAADYRGQILRVEQSLPNGGCELGVCRLGKADGFRLRPTRGVDDEARDDAPLDLRGAKR
jgi:hypothetical protein